MIKYNQIKPSNTMLPPKSLLVKDLDLKDDM